MPRDTWFLAQGVLAVVVIAGAALGFTRNKVGDVVENVFGNVAVAHLTPSAPSGLRRSNVTVS